MHRERLGHALLRTAFAVLFGFMSLLHGPVVAFTKSNPAVAHHTLAGDDRASHHHHAPATGHSTPALPDAVPACSGVGCFIALEAIPIGAPAASFNPIGSLLPGLARAMMPAQLDPPVPPPRSPV